MALRITSPAFGDGDPIPDRHSKSGDNLSPPLQWTGAPPGTRSFALVVEDPDAPSGIFRHWALHGIPAGRTGLAEGEDLSALGHGVNDFGGRGYDGPRPPRGHGVHHYHFRLMALDTDRLPGLGPQATAAEVRQAARRHLIEEADLVGTYETT